MEKAIYTKKAEVLCQILKQARGSRHQQEIADTLGRTDDFVSRYENGQRRLDTIEFFEVCEALGIDPYATLKKWETLSA